MIQVFVHYEEIPWKWKDLDDLIQWIGENYTHELIHLIVDDDPDALMENAVKEIWIGDCPPGRGTPLEVHEEIEKRKKEKEEEEWFGS